MATLICLLAACRSHRASVSSAPIEPSRSTEVDAGVATPLAVSRDASNRPSAPAQPETWCVRSLPHVVARAIDPRGHVFALHDDGMIQDETLATPPVRLAAMTPHCDAPYDHLAFTHDGSAIAIWRGRVYFRRAQDPMWIGTPACSDIAGEPWAPRSDGSGWSLVGRRIATAPPALLMTEDARALSGWYAVTALDQTTTAIAVEGGGSFVALTSGGHAVLVDRERHVAGEVLVANDLLWDGLTRTDAGFAMWHDTGPTTRDVVLGTTVTARFDRQHRVRPAGARTLSVFAAEFGRVVSVTDRGVEWWASGDQPFVEVARWPQGSARSASQAMFGWVAEAPAVVTPDALVARRCP